MIERFASVLDKLADKLEEAGNIKEAYGIDVIANTIEKIAEAEYSAQKLGLIGGSGIYDKKGAIGQLNLFLKQVRASMDKIKKEYGMKALSAENRDKILSELAAAGINEHTISSTKAYTEKIYNHFRLLTRDFAARLKSYNYHFPETALEKLKEFKAAADNASLTSIGSLFSLAKSSWSVVTVEKMWSEELSKLEEFIQNMPFGSFKGRRQDNNKGVSEQPQRQNDPVPPKKTRIPVPSQQPVKQDGRSNLDRMRDKIETFKRNQGQLNSVR